LANDPQVLIIDEPTNHLDLPSIEELENALIGYHGAVIYISHDSFFARKLGGQTITIGN
jgi:ATPase subunit of ABC transporter with duplicated ATPase domains